MALSDLAVYSEYAYSSMTEVLDQQIELFNGATAGAIQLGRGAHQGDYSDKAFFKKMTGVVRRRNAYGTGTVSQKVLEHLVDTMVKIAAGTPEIRLDKGQFLWIQQNPEVAGAALGQQLALESMADMLNTALGCAWAALGQVSAVVYDATANSAAADKLLTFANLNNGQSKFGDASSQIAAWVMHSKPMHDLYGNAIANAANLFNYGNINVRQDPFGKLLIMTDSPNLTYVNTTPDPDVSEYVVLGLVPGAIMIDQNNDFDAMEQGETGGENLIRTYQAEWSWELGIKGFSWDKSNGGKSPNDAALLTATNWDRIATSHKDLAGVAIKTR